MYDFKILIYLAFILIISLFPVYLFRKRVRDVAIIGGIIIYFFVLNRHFIWARLGVWHDTRVHEYLLIILKQWCDGFVPIGWNSYMSGGEPLYLLSNSFLWTQWILFCWINKLITLDPHTLFNLFWVFQFVIFCIGSLLLFLVLYDDFRVSLFCFISLIISGMFIVNLGQPTGLNTICYFPYILFCFISSYKRKNIYGIALATVFLGIALNHYLPHYIFLSVGIFLFFALALHIKSLPSGLRLLKRQYKILLLALVISLLVACPALYLYIEMQNYISPTRGALLSGGAIEFGQTGSQPCVNAPLSGYKVFLRGVINYRWNIHHAFYFGVIPVLLLPVVIFRWKDKYALAVFGSAIAIIFLSTGNDFLGYRLLIKHVPGFNMVRHSFGLAQFASFLLICLSGYGLKELLCRELDGTINSRLGILLSAWFVILLLAARTFNVALLGALGTAAIVFLIIRKRALWGKSKHSLIRAQYLLLIFLLFVDLTSFYVGHSKTRLLDKRPVSLANIVYPSTRTFYPLRSYPIPPDISPLISKKASLTHQKDDFILFRNRSLDNMLRLFTYERGCEHALGVNGPIIYFTRHASVVFH